MKEEVGVLYDATTKTLLCGDLFRWHGEFGADFDRRIAELS